jgi:hypothetical protein
MTGVILSVVAGRRVPLPFVARSAQRIFMRGQPRRVNTRLPQIGTSAHAADRVTATDAARGAGHAAGGQSATAKLCRPRTEANGKVCHGQQPESLHVRRRARSRLYEFSWSSLGCLLSVAGRCAC